MLKDAGGSGIMTAMGIPSFFDDSSYGEDMGGSYSSYSDTPGDQGGGGDGFGGGDEFARPTYSQQLKTLQDPMMQPGTTGETFPGLSKITPRDIFRVSASNPLLHRSYGERAAIASIPVIGPLITMGEANAYSLPMFQYSRTGGKKTINPPCDRDWETMD